MNLLAEAQKKMLEHGISEEEYAQRREAFLKLYYEYRRKNENSALGRLSLHTRQKLHPLVLAVYKAKNRLGGFRCVLMKDERKKAERPVIYTVTHVGKFDIEVVSEALKEHYYLLSGDYEHIQGTVDEPFLSLNGVFYFNETEKSDRKAVTEKMTALLQEGGNLMYFPEGTWNLTPNLPVLPCYWGIVEIARQGNAVIVPVAAEQYGKRFEVNIGRNFDMMEYGSSAQEKSRAISDLRDALATLKWEIWEKHHQKRQEILDGEWSDYQKERFREWPYFNLEYIDGLIYKPKGIISSEQAFSHLRTLCPSRENAFLLRKQYEEEQE